MDYILIQFDNGDLAYQEIMRGQVVRYTDMDGVTVSAEGRGSVVVGGNPPPAWALPDPVDEPVPSVPTRILSKLAYLRLFSQQERIAVRNAATQSPELFDYLDMLKLADEIDLMDADTVAAVQMLEAAGLIAPGRAGEILNA